MLDYEPVEISDDSTKNGKTKRKALPATYEPDKRTSAWLKLKKDYVDGVGDSLDLVPIGAWYGNGRKAGWWSPVLLGLWNPETGVPVAVCKCMSGKFHRWHLRIWRLTTVYMTVSVFTGRLQRCILQGRKDPVITQERRVGDIEADALCFKSLLERYPIDSDSCSAQSRWECDSGGT